jgi:ribonuclease HI
MSRVFSGEIIIPDGPDAKESDAVRFQDTQEDIALGHAAVCFADGSEVHKGPHAGFLGAGVVWQDWAGEVVESYGLGRYTGNSEGAEIYALAAALGLVVKEVSDGRAMSRFRVYTDAQQVLQSIRDGTAYHIGPMLEEKTAVQSLYDYADFLNEAGVEVQLCWVKGHSKSAGNEAADRAAETAVQWQTAHVEYDDRREMGEADVPQL